VILVGFIIIIVVVVIYVDLICEQY